MIINPKILLLSLLGFASGLPLSLSGDSFKTWLAVEGLDVQKLAWLSILGLPYTIKFLWAPLLDCYSPLGKWGDKLLDRRRLWSLLFLWAMSLICFLLGHIEIKNHDIPLELLCVLGFSLAFFSASFDAVVDGYRTVILTKEEKGYGITFWNFAYRMAMLLTGGIAFIWAETKWGWSGNYQLFSLLLFISSFVLFLLPKAEINTNANFSPMTAFILPLKELLKRDAIVFILAFIIFYKLGDAFAGALRTKFLLDQGYSQSLIGSINKTVGLIANITGSLLSAVLISKKIRLSTLVIACGLLQLFSNAGFLLITDIDAVLLKSQLAVISKDLTWFELLFAQLKQAPQAAGLLTVVVFVEEFCGGLGNTVFLTLLMTWTMKKFATGQYALFASIASIGRIFLSPITGTIQKSFGWEAVFISSMLVALPGLIIAWFLRSLMDKQPTEEIE